MVQDKEIVFTILGASVGTASLLLVFEGFLVSAYRNLVVAGGRTEATHRWYQQSVWAVVALLFLNLGLTLSALAWLLDVDLFNLIIALFVGVVVAVWLLAAWVALHLVR